MPENLEALRTDCIAFIREMKDFFASEEVAKTDLDKLMISTICDQHHSMAVTLLSRMEHMLSVEGPSSLVTKILSMQSKLEDFRDALVEKREEGGGPGDPGGNVRIPPSPFHPGPCGSGSRGPVLAG